MGNKIFELSHEELILVDGGNTKPYGCRTTGQSIGRTLADNVIVDAITETVGEIYDRLKKLFN